MNTADINKALQEDLKAEVNAMKLLVDNQPDKDLIRQMLEEVNLNFVDVSDIAKAPQGWRTKWSLNLANFLNVRLTSDAPQWSGLSFEAEIKIDEAQADYIIRKNPKADNFNFIRFQKLNFKRVY